MVQIGKRNFGWEERESKPVHRNNWKREELSPLWRRPASSARSA
jgi:hypothetical protein